jgi:hypothetical protein
MGDVTAKKFRGACNNGWLSALEESTRKFLGPMVEGQSVVLQTAEQSLIATWALKPALTPPSVCGPAGG